MESLIILNGKVQVELVMDKARITVEDNMCKACELCVVSCPMSCIKLSDKFNDKGFHPIEFSFRGERGECTACGICFNVCPDAAITSVEVLLK